MAPQATKWTIFNFEDTSGSQFFQFFQFLGSFLDFCPKIEDYVCSPNFGCDQYFFNRPKTGAGLCLFPSQKLLHKCSGKQTNYKSTIVETKKKNEKF